uniref:Gamma-glutamylcyclotransferase n=1 Tax=Cyanistes caeruleus TaxID=156563 RepID=A0A8C0Z8U9_CYACU
SWPGRGVPAPPPGKVWRLPSALEPRRDGGEWCGAIPSSAVLSPVRRSPGACTWGVAYEVRGEQIAASLEYLNMREAVLGGYDTKLVKFHPQEKDTEEPILALVYIATPQNPSYLGPASEEDIAAQIIVSSGCAGHNIEYLLRLADFMRYFCPQAEDKHLFSIEEALVSILPCLYYTEDSLEESASVPQKTKS